MQDTRVNAIAVALLGAVLASDHLASVRVRGHLGIAVGHQLQVEPLAQSLMSGHNLCQEKVVTIGTQRLEVQRNRGLVK